MEATERRLREQGSLQVERLVMQHLDVAKDESGDGKVVPFGEHVNSAEGRIEILIGQIDGRLALNGLGRKIVFEVASDGTNLLSVSEGLFGASDNSLQFGRLLDNDKCDVGMFKEGQLYGLGKRVNPN